MSKINLGHRFRKTLGRALKCKGTANIFTINLQDPDSGDSLLSYATYVTCMSKQDFADIALESMEKLKKEHAHDYEIDDFWVTFEKRLKQNAIPILNEHIDFHF